MKYTHEDIFERVLIITIMAMLGLFLLFIGMSWTYNQFPIGPIAIIIGVCMIAVGVYALEYISAWMEFERDHKTPKKKKREKEKNKK
jgi:hypothetical protein